MRNKFYHLGIAACLFIFSLPAMASENVISVGSRIHDGNYHSGQVVHVDSANGLADVAYDDQYGGVGTARLSDLIESVPCSPMSCSPGSIRAHNRVFHPHFGSGKVLEVFADGVAKVDFDNYPSFVWINASWLSKSVPCYEGICAKKRYFDPRYGGGGAVMEAYSSGIKVDFDNWNSFVYLLDPSTHLDNSWVAENYIKRADPLLGRAQRENAPEAGDGTQAAGHLAN